jgi:DNA-binding GntR family transcriptional regulator
VVTTDTQQEAAYRAIRDAILDGFMQPDAPLSVRGLSEALNVGTMPARTAVQRLIAERALEFTSSRKIRVPVLSRAELADLFSVITDLEALVFRRIVGRLSAADFTRLHDLVADIRGQIDCAEKQTLLRLTRAFWFDLYERSGSPVLVQVIENLWLRLSPVMVQTHARPMADPGQSYDNARHYERYGRILEALEAGSMEQAVDILRELDSSLLQWFSVHYGFRDGQSEFHVDLNAERGRLVHGDPRQGRDVKGHQRVV